MLKNWKTSFSVLILFFAGILPAGEPFLKETPDSRWKLTQYARWTATADGSTELEVHIAPDAPIRNETYGANLGIDLAPYKGKTIVISGLISADGIPQGEKSHCCAKLMLFHKGPEGSRYYSSSAGLPYDGDAWYRISVVIPESWKGRPLFFDADTIDDLDWVWFNGSQIGHTSEKTPKYWSARRLYRIPSEMVRYGGKNVLAIRVRDLRGNGGILGKVRIGGAKAESGAVFFERPSRLILNFDPNSWRQW